MGKVDIFASACSNLSTLATTGLLQSGTQQTLADRGCSADAAEIEALLMQLDCADLDAKKETFTSEGLDDCFISNSSTTPLATLPEEPPCEDPEASEAAHTPPQHTAAITAGHHAVQETSAQLPTTAAAASPVPRTLSARLRSLRHQFKAAAGFMNKPRTSELSTPNKLSTMTKQDDSSGDAIMGRDPCEYRLSSPDSFSSPNALQQPTSSPFLWVQRLKHSRRQSPSAPPAASSEDTTCEPPAAPVVAAAAAADASEGPQSMRPAPPGKSSKEGFGMAFLVKLRALRSLTAQAAAAEDDSSLLFSTKHHGGKASPRASDCSHMAAMGSKRSTGSSSPGVSEGGVDTGSSSPGAQWQQEEHGQDDTTVAVAEAGPASDAVAQDNRCSLAEEPEAAAQAATGC